MLSSEAPPVAGLPRHVPRDCGRLLVKVPDPGAKVGQGAFDIAAGYRGALLKANHRIGAGGACIEHLADEIERGAK